MLERKSTPVFALILLILGTSSHAADLYRWQDEKGNVHYTDRVPPEYVKQGYRVISEQGLTIHTIRSKSETDAEAKSTQVPELPPEQVRRNQRLLMTYANEKEIITVRDRRLADIQALNDLGVETISLLEMQYRQLAKEASDYEKQGMAIPETLLAQTVATRKKINKYQIQIEKNQQEMIRLKQEYDNDLERYRQLRSFVDQIKD